MDIIEIFANRRSGHHFFLSWFTSNLLGTKDTETKELNRVTWLTPKAAHMNDASYHAFFDYEGTIMDIGAIALKSPDYIFLNYEDAGMSNKVADYLSSNEIPTTKVIFIRDFLNMMASKWKVSRGDMEQFYFGFEREDIILDNIRDWKDMAKAYLSNKYARISYEDILLKPEVKDKFLWDNFGKREIFPSNQVEGTKSSFASSDFNSRYKEVEFNQLFKDLTMSDPELRMLIHEMGYNPIESIL